jgi:hypothetical protein
MRNILWSEWEARAAELAPESARRHRAVDVQIRAKYEIEVRSPSVSGAVAPVPSASEDGMPLAFKVGGSSCVSASPPT